MRGGWGERAYLLGHIADGGQDAQDVEEAIMVVLALDGAATVALGQLLEDRGGDEGGAEEGRVGVGDGRLERHGGGVVRVWMEGCRCGRVGCGLGGAIACWVLCLEGRGPFIDNEAVRDYVRGRETRRR